jgi:hypothetical protein
MVLKTYLDDSSDQKREKVVLYGGVVGNGNEWKQFSNKWKVCLRENGIKYFRESEYRWLSGQFRPFRDPIKYPKPKGKQAASVIRDELKAIIDATNVKTFAVGVFIPDYNHVLRMKQFKGTLNPLPGDIAFQSIMYEITARVRRLPSPHKVAFVCDLCNQSDRLSQIYRAFRKKNPKTAKVTWGLTHLDDKKIPALQAADLAAHLAHDMLLDKLRTGTNPLPEELREKTHLVAYWDEGYLLDVFKAQSTRNGGKGRRGERGSRPKR